MSEEKPLNVPEYLLIRSAEARAKHLGISVEQALAEIKGESQPVEEPVVEEPVAEVEEVVEEPVVEEPVEEPVVEAEETNQEVSIENKTVESIPCLLYTSPSPRDKSSSRMPSSA